MRPSLPDGRAASVHSQESPLSGLSALLAHVLDDDGREAPRMRTPRKRAALGVLCKRPLTVRPKKVTIGT